VNKAAYQIEIIGTGKSELPLVPQRLKKVSIVAGMVEF